MDNKTALMVVDMQVAPFIWHQYGGKALFEAERLLTNVKQLITKARQSAATIVYTQYTEGDESQVWQNGSPLWEIHPEVKPMAEDLVIMKYHADPFYQTNLDAQLKEKGINCLVIAGLQTEFCVDTTCRCSCSLGYQNILISDAHSTTAELGVVTPQQIIAHHNGVLGRTFAALQSTDEIVWAKQ